MSANAPIAPLFSVIVPTCRRNDSLALCLEKLSPEYQVPVRNGYEVIVSDDGGESSPPAMLKKRFPWAKWVKGPGCGPAANRNNGAKHAVGDWLVFIDDDCLPDQSLLAAYAKVISRGPRALEGAIHPVGDMDYDLAECPVNTQGGYFWSANVAIERNLFESIGGFDPAYPMAAHEDQDIYLRICAETAVPFVADARVEHPVRNVTLRKAVADLPRKCQAWAIHANKHRKSLAGDSDFWILWTAGQMHLRIGAKSLLRGHLRGAVLKLLWATVGSWLTYRHLRRLRNEN